MYLSFLTLKNFRNYQDHSLSFDPQFNLIIGKNAQGKTNLLEAVYYLSYLKSFRTQEKEDVLRNGSFESHLLGLLMKEEVEHRIQVQIHSRQKEVKLNGKKPNLFRDYYGLMPVLLFEPQDVYLFRDSPSERRRYINRALFLEEPLYLKRCREYEEVVKQKNKLLKEDQSSFVEDQLPVWNERLVAVGTGIVWERLCWIKDMNLLIAEEYALLAKGRESLRLEYSSPLVGEKERRMNEEGMAFITGRFRELLEERQAEEIRRCESLVGPHRDDWRVFLGDRPLSPMGSQGEHRSAVIALKMAQIGLFQSQKGFAPLFLLDDVASELDSMRQHALFQRLQNTKGQVFLSTIEPEAVEPFLKGKGTSFVIEEGRVRVLV